MTEVIYMLTSHHGFNNLNSCLFRDLEERKTKQSARVICEDKCAIVNGTDSDFVLLGSNKLSGLFDTSGPVFGYLKFDQEIHFLCFVLLIFTTV